MGNRFSYRLILATLCIACATWSAAAQPPKGDATDKNAIAKNAEAFVAAFHKGDAAAVAAFWAADGEYSDHNGRQLKGRDAIQKEFKDFFATFKGAKVNVISESLKFLTPDVAIEEGVTEVYPNENASPSRARYVNTHVKKDGKWQLASVKESPHAPPSNFNNLKGLSWAIGAWASEGDKGPSERLAVAWDDNQNFIHANFATTLNDVSLGSANQVIGWDPDAKRIRSWIFDSTGAFGEGAWSQDGMKWTIKTKTTLQDGKKASATIVVGPVDDDTISLQMKERMVDGMALPELKETKLKRVK